MQQVLDNLMGLPGTPGVADLDLIFLRGIMESPIVRSLAKVRRHGGRVCPPRDAWGVTRCVCVRAHGGGWALARACAGRLRCFCVCTSRESLSPKTKGP